MWTINATVNKSIKRQSLMPTVFFSKSSLRGSYVVRRLCIQFNSDVRNMKITFYFRASELKGSFIGQNDTITPEWTYRYTLA